MAADLVVEMSLLVTLYDVESLAGISLGIIFLGFLLFAYFRTRLFALLALAAAHLLLVDQMTVTLREVTQEDLPMFFEHQLDAEATRMAAFPSRDRDAFMAHWARIISNESGILNTILADDAVAGNVVYWEAAGEPNIGYWLGKTHWGKGIANAALAQFLTKIEARPVYAHVAKHNFASIRVLQKCGFQLAREDICDGDDGEELVMELRSDRCATAANKPTKT